MKSNGHYDMVNNTSYITISPNPNTLKAVMTLDTNYQVDFTQANTLRSILGFNSQVYGAGEHESEQIVDILKVNSILVSLDIVENSYVDGKLQPSIFSFFPNVAPGYKIVEKPVNVVYSKIIKNSINSIEFKITDQDGELINFRGERISIRLHIREI